MPASNRKAKKRRAKGLPVLTVPDAGDFKKLFEELRPVGPPGAKTRAEIAKELGCENKDSRRVRAFIEQGLAAGRIKQCWVDRRKPSGRQIRLMAYTVVKPKRRRKK